MGLVWECEREQDLELSDSQLEFDLEPNVELREAEREPRVTFNCLSECEGEGCFLGFSGDGISSSLCRSVSSENTLPCSLLSGCDGVGILESS